MRHSLVRPILTLIAFIILAAQAVPAPAQQSGVDVYAITNACIVTVSGPVIERGTVVIRNGLIHMVGASVKAPADARIIDGTGLTIYPGLLDAYTNLGMPQPSPAPGTNTAGGSPLVQQSSAQTTSSPNSTQPPGLQPELLAIDLLQAGGPQIEAARSAGITAALTAPREGILMGQSALINLAGDSAQQMIVRTPIALHVGFTPLRGGSYPQSLMGVFSALRQMLIDAEHYREAQAVYEKNPRGLRRPLQDKSLAALLPALSREMPVIMQANTEREIQRALDLAREFNLRLIIAGGRESWKVADRLREQNVEVLFSLNFPKRTTAQVPEADPEPLRILRERVDAPKTPARLGAARVRFAFQSGAPGEMASYLANAAKTVENGLAREEALRAMTVRPAEILGVADRLGTIEVGKIANLTITRGDIFERTARIAYVFIDGRPVDLKPAALTATGAGTLASGNWTLNLNLGEGETVITLALEQTGEQLRGSIQGALGSGQIANGSIGQGGDLRFTVPVNIGGLTTEAAFTGTISGNEMRGTIQIVGRAPGSFTGTRIGSAPPASTPPARPTATQPTPGAPPATSQPAAPAAELAGTWSIKFVIGEQSVPATLVLERRGVILTGTLQGPFPTAEIIMGSIDANGFRFTSVVQLGGENIELTFEGSAVEFELRSKSGSAVFSRGKVMFMNGTVTSALGTVKFTGERPLSMIRQ
ncbi:MAG TPA: amidohydrolase family protein [Pyrinomonadaceae bacterium]|jgi:imidazolonepropionase-like amidohydrolase